MIVPMRAACTLDRAEARKWNASCSAPIGRNNLMHKTGRSIARLIEFGTQFEGSNFLFYQSPAAPLGLHSRGGSVFRRQRDRHCSASHLPPDKLPKAAGPQH